MINFIIFENVLYAKVNKFEFCISQQDNADFELEITNTKTGQVSLSFFDSVLKALEAANQFYNLYQMRFNCVSN